MVYANKINENSDLSMTYLGQTKMTRDTKIKAEERFPITPRVHFRKTVRWHGMSNSTRHRCYKIIHSKSYYLWVRLYMHYQNSLQILREFK